MIRINKYIFTLLYNIADIDNEDGIIHDFYCANERTAYKSSDKDSVINKLKNKKIYLDIYKTLCLYIKYNKLSYS